METTRECDQLKNDLILGGTVALDFGSVLIARTDLLIRAGRIPSE